MFSPQAGDIDGDGHDELLVHGRALLLHGEPCYRRFAPSYALFIADVGDIDGDGRDEIAYRSGTQIELFDP